MAQLNRPRPNRRIPNSMQILNLLSSVSSKRNVYMYLTNTLYMGFVSRDLELNLLINIYFTPSNQTHMSRASLSCLMSVRSFGIWDRIS